MRTSGLSLLVAKKTRRKVTGVGIFDPSHRFFRRPNKIASREQKPKVKAGDNWFSADLFVSDAPKHFEATIPTSKLMGDPKILFFVANLIRQMKNVSMLPGMWYALDVTPNPFPRFFSTNGYCFDLETTGDASRLSFLSHSCTHNPPKCLTARPTQ